MIPLDAILVPISAALGLSLVVERILEFIKNILEPLLAPQKSQRVPDLSRIDGMITDLEATHHNDTAFTETEKQAESQLSQRQKMKEELEKETDPARRRALYEKLKQLEERGEWNEKITKITLAVKPATDPDDGTTVKVFTLQMLGFALGIILVHYAGIQLFNSFLSSLESPLRLQPWLDYFLSGLLIGGGSTPMHALVKFITQQKVVTRPEAPQQSGTGEYRSEEYKPAPVESRSQQPGYAYEFPPFAYTGGVDCERLEYAHLREKDPDCIVYHHTGMHSGSSFIDVVRVVQNSTDADGEKWLTGYHCVILEDGSIHPFCRWDRSGNHAVGVNRRSLGIAFNGNFEADPAIPFSNSDGRYGRPRPTEQQLRAGAQIITLWSFLYSIPVDFERAILPHSKLSSNSCPGSLFPHYELLKWIDYYRTKWEKSTSIQAQIAEFKLKPYLYIKKEEV
ncbi:N-acetylmuramoyl-L-alanine amidase [candidate division KSB1 bacterium]|nr:N-acetylmuramoyl-L-alanine amidase [candidate division KSB1 bacterium]